MLMSQQMTSWQSEPQYLAEANERDSRDIGAMQPHSFTLSRLEIAKAHQFLAHYRINIKYHGSNQVSKRQIDNFDIRALRVNFERLG